MAPKISVVLFVVYSLTPRLAWGQVVTTNPLDAMKAKVEQVL